MIKRNLNILFLGLLAAISLSFCNTSIRKKSKEIEILIEKLEERTITIKITNTGSDKYLLRMDKIFGSRRYLFFEDAPEVHFKGSLDDDTFPFGILDSSILYSENFLAKNCFISDTLKSNLFLHPGEMIKISHNFQKDYTGFIAGKEYKVYYMLYISENFEIFCPLFWSGKAYSNKITWKCDNVRQCTKRVGRVKQ